MSELVCLELSVLLWLAHVLCRLFTARAEFGDAYLLGPRDEKKTPKGLLASLVYCIAALQFGGDV